MPKAILTLLRTIMNGANLTLKNHHENVYKQEPCLSISQLLVYDTYKWGRQMAWQIFQDVVKIESPLFSCILASQTRQSNLVSNLHNVGISV